MGGGKERKASMQMQTQIANDQNATSKEYLNLAKQEQANRTELQQPSIDHYMKLISGNPSERMNAVAVPLGDLAKTTKSAREAAYETSPRGAARDFALSQIPMQQSSQAAELLNTAYNSAFPALSGLGTEAGQVGLQQTGAGMRSGEAAGQTNQSVMNAQQQAKASQLGMIGSLAGLGASAATGGFGGAAKAAAGGAKAASSFDPIKFLQTPGALRSF